jgi:hypothetical protein
MVDSYEIYGEQDEEYTDIEVNEEEIGNFSK